MPDKLILSKAVEVTAIYVNAKQNGDPYWRVQTPTKDVFFTCYDPKMIPFIEGLTPREFTSTYGKSKAFNFNPALPVMVYFEATAKGMILEETPSYVAKADGSPAPDAKSIIAAAVAGADQAKSGGQRPGGWGGYQGKSGGGWKPEDKRPSLVTMSEAFAKDIVTAIIGHNADLGNMDPAHVMVWAQDATIKLSKVFLNNALDELKALGFDITGGAK